MVRWLVSIVFCISIVAGSNAHASMMNGKALHAASPVHQTSLTNCWEDAAHAIASEELRCTHMTNSRSGGQRCQIDVAPLVSALDLPSRAGSRGNAQTPHQFNVGVERAPPLAPPRLFQVS